MRLDSWLLRSCNWSVLYSELCYIVIVQRKVLCILSRWSSLADWAGFLPPPLVQIDLSVLTCRWTPINNQSINQSIMYCIVLLWLCYLLKNDELWTGEQERHQPCNRYHTIASRLCRCWQTSHWLTYGPIAIETHRNQYECRTRQSHNLQSEHGNTLSCFSFIASHWNITRRIQLVLLITALLYLTIRIILFVRITSGTYVLVTGVM